MKTKTRFAKRLVVVTCALVVTQSALAFYNPSTGRWLNRDPIAEKGGKNLYEFANNDSLRKLDPDGRAVSDLATACCDDKKRREGWAVLFWRFHNAAKFLDSHGVTLDPDSETGVSCIDSANRILAFMSPIPPCWTCYIQRRSWNYNPFGGDENSILCKPNKNCGFGMFPIVFDWWWQKYKGVKYYQSYPFSVYTGWFPYDINPPIGGWWTEDNPAPHDD